jgi:hypothetical protein
MRKKVEHTYIRPGSLDDASQYLYDMKSHKIAIWQDKRNNPVWAFTGSLYNPWFKTGKCQGQLAWDVTR